MQIFLFIIVLFVLFVLFYLNKDKFLDSIQFNYKNVYELKKLFTNSEIKFYKSLQKYLENKEVVLFSKVRLADMLNIKKGFSKSKQTTYFNYISKKHIDFVITDLNGNIKVLIELDGFSHNFDKTKKSDDFKNKVFENLNIPLKRFNVSNSYDFSVLENLL